MHVFLTAVSLPPVQQVTRSAICTECRSGPVGKAGRCEAHCLPERRDGSPCPPLPCPCIPLGWRRSAPGPERWCGCDRSLWTSAPLPGRGWGKQLLMLCMRKTPHLQFYINMNLFSIRLSKAMYDRKQGLQAFVKGPTVKFISQPWDLICQPSNHKYSLLTWFSLLLSF